MTTQKKVLVTPIGGSRHVQILVDIGVRLVRTVTSGSSEEERKG